MPENELVERFGTIQAENLERVSSRLLPGLGDLAIAVTGPEKWTDEWNGTLNELVEGFAELRSVNA